MICSFNWKMRKILRGWKMPLLKRIKGWKIGRNLHSKMRSYDKIDSFPRTFTPLTKQPAELLEVVLRMPGIQFPYGHDNPPRQPQSEKFCKFHNEYGHYTNDCRNLKMTIEKLIQEGELLEYVRKEFHTLKKRREEAQEDPSKEQEKTQYGKNHQNKGTINMIHRGLLGGSSNRSRKAYI